MFDCEALLEGQVMKDVKRKKNVCTLVLLFNLAVYVSQINGLVV